VGRRGSYKGMVSSSGELRARGARGGLEGAAW